ncbi:MAG: DUF934 domain-containing protein [Herminiimonas sp.]|nr:DUF934 domain-containing protein [Herminiimonas sp.]
MSEVIKLIDGAPTIVDDDWVMLREDAPQHELGAHTIFPFAAMSSDTKAVRAVWISPDDDFEQQIENLLNLDLIAVDFSSFRDGRGYSVATLLRTRYGWRGELRAVGEVLRDQLNYLRRCGFDCFAVSANKDIRDAIKSFSHYSVQYQGSVDNPLPLFRKRRVGST